MLKFNLPTIKKLSSNNINKIRAGLKELSDFPFQVAHINLNNKTDPSSVLKKDNNSLTIVSDLHSYKKKDRIFPINQDENTVFAGYVYNDSKKYKYKRVLDMGTGSGVISVASAKAGTKEVIATDINKRAKKFVEMNNEVNNTNVVFKLSNLFKDINGKFDKITMNPPFMPSPKSNDYPLHAQSQTFGFEAIIEPFFKKCWNYLNKNGCVQIITQSFANDKKDSFIEVMKKYLPKGWSYSIQHIFPIKYVPIDLYTSHFVDFPNYKGWIKKIENKGYKYMKFFMITIRNDGKNGLQKEIVSEPRLYNLIYPPTTLNYLSKNLETKLLKEPISEKDWITIGHLMRLSRYNYLIYQSLKNLLR